VINGDGSISGISVGGLPDGTVDAGTLATNSVDSAELVDGSIDTAHIGTDQITSAILPAGSILQVVDYDGGSGSQVSTSSSTFAATGEEIVITPSSTSSKILVIAVWNAQVLVNGDNQAEGEFKLVGTTNGDLMLHRYQNYDYGGSGLAQTSTQNMTVLDTPSSTSEQTYSIHYRLIDGDYLRMNNANKKANMIAIEFKG
jgi:hypothetical protein